jgi:hypothetical protein
MGIHMADGRYANVQEARLDPHEGTLTTDGYSQVLELGDRGTLRLTLDVTSVSDSDVVDVTIQTSRDGVTWYSAGTFTQVTQVGAEHKAFAIDRFVRAHFNVTGSGVSIACTLRGESV